MKLSKPHPIINDRCSQRNEQGFSLAVVLALCGVVSIAVAGAYSFILPTYQRAQSLRYTTVVRSAAEACADYVVADLNNANAAGKASTYDSANELQNTCGQTLVLSSANGQVTTMPNTIVPSSNGVQPSVTVTVWNVNPPRPGALGYSTCAFYDKNRDYKQQAVLPQKNYYRVVLATAKLGSITKNVRVVLCPNYTCTPTVPLFQGAITGGSSVLVGGYTGTDAYNGTNGYYKQKSGSGSSATTNAVLYQGNVISNGYIQLGKPVTNPSSAFPNLGPAIIGGNMVSYATGTQSVTSNTTSLSTALGGGSIANDPTSLTTATLAGNSIASGSIVQGTVSTSGPFVSGGTPTYVFSNNSTSTGNVQDLAVLQPYLASPSTNPSPPATGAGIITGAPPQGSVNGVTYAADSSNLAPPLVLPPVPGYPTVTNPVNSSLPATFPNIANTSVSTVQVSNGGMVYVANGATQPTGALVIGSSTAQGGTSFGGRGSYSNIKYSASIPPGPYSTGSIFTVGGPSLNQNIPSGFPSNLNKDPVTGASVDGSGIVIASNVTTPLQFYVQGPASGNTAVVIADGGLTNLTNDPSMSQIYYSGSKGVWLGDSDGSTSQQFVMYAPNAPIQIDAIGQGMSSSGAVVGNSVNFQGGTNGTYAMLHFDTRLLTNKLLMGSTGAGSYSFTSLQAVSWQEF